VDGRIKWIVDGYTTQDKYPYSRKISFDETTNDTVTDRNQQADEQINYIRNSVKATVDAYDGTVDLYALDDKDPVLKTWQGVFPGLVKPASEIPNSLREHFRYPADLYKIQRRLLSEYHVDNPSDFYS